MKYVICMVDSKTEEVYELEIVSTVAEASRKIKQEYRRAMPYTDFAIKNVLTMGLYREGEY